MLLALTVLALFGLWWLGRNDERLPAGLNLRVITGYALLAVAALALLRGSLVLALLSAAGGAFLLKGRGFVPKEAAGLFDRLRRAMSGSAARGRTVERTALLEPQRNPDGAPVDAHILAGPQTGFRLSQLDLGDLAALLALCRKADPEGARFLETYLDRRSPGWRVDAEADSDARTGGPLQPGAMTQEEAYQVLGLERGASLDEIRAAHRTLMKRLHPDQGGTAEAAARLNAARDLLTNRHR